jgi:hypothetical protein
MVKQPKLTQKKLLTVLCQNNCAEKLRELAANKQLFELLPELEPLAQVRQMRSCYPDDSVLYHSFLAVQNMEIPFKLHSLNKRELLLFVLLHDVGKGIDYRGHIKEGRLIFLAILQRFGFKQKVIENLLILYEQHLLLVHLSFGVIYYNGLNMQTTPKQKMPINSSNFLTPKEIKKLCKTKENLKILVQITKADTLAVAPDYWYKQKVVTLSKENFIGIIVNEVLTLKS